MGVPQNGIFAFGTSAHGYFELDLATGVVAGSTGRRRSDVMRIERHRPRIA